MKSITPFIGLHLLLTMGALCACTENQEQDVATEFQTFTATFAEGPVTRTLLANASEGERNVLWAEGDKVSIDGKLFTAGNISSDGMTATLTGMGAEKEADGKYRAYYPSGIVEDRVLSLPGTQNYRGKDASTGLPIIDEFPMYAESATSQLTFRNLCAVFAFSIAGPTNQKVTKVVVSSKDKALWGPFTLDEGTVVMNGEDEGYRTLVLSCGNGISLSATPQTFFVAIPPGQYDPGNVSVVFYNGNNVVESMGNKQAMALESSHIYDIDGSVNTYFFGISQDKFSVNYLSGSQRFRIYSYKKDAITGQEREVGWSALFSTDGGNTWSDTRPEWLTVFETSGPGSIGYVDNNIAYARNPDISQKTWKGTTAVQAATPQQAIDLSMRDIYGNPWAQTTANCYVITAPGWYKIPCVYGNGIRKNLDNQAAYTDFYGHAGLITAPWIKDNGIVLKDAVLCWQDHEEMIATTGQNAPFFSDGSDGLTPDYLYFYADPEHCFQGNALLAVRTDEDGDGTADTIAWSWHIWMTEGLSDELKTQAVYSHTSVSYKSAQYPNQMMNSNLGWCDKEVFIATPRSVIIKLTQDGSGQVRTCELRQLGRTLTSYGTNTLYQHGRKDPMSSLNGIQEEQGFKPLYPENGPFLLKGRAEQGSLSESVALPYVVFSNGSPIDPRNTGNWCTIYNTELWDKGMTSDSQDRKVVKTIYDPCPLGFHVPNYYAFTGFSTTGRNTGNASEMNRAGTASFDSEKGAYFYCDPDGVETTPGEALIFFPCCGSMNYNHSTEAFSFFGVGWQGATWTATKGSLSGNQGSLWLFSYNKIELTNNGCHVCYPVRPVAEIE